MNLPRRVLPVLLSVFVFTLLASPTSAMISVGVLTKEKAKEKYGITMHGSNEGDVGYYLKVKDFLDVKNPVTEK